MQQFQCQEVMNLVGIVAEPAEVALDYRPNPLGVEIPSTERPGIQQHFADVIRKNIAIPDAKMVKLVPAEKESLWMQRRNGMIDAGQPVRHTAVVGVFRFEEKF
jgi:hypothetical protein